MSALYYGKMKTFDGPRKKPDVLIIQFVLFKVRSKLGNQSQGKNRAELKEIMAEKQCPFVSVCVRIIKKYRKGVLL